jgi:hypothetical protein
MFLAKTGGLRAEQSLQLVDFIGLTNVAKPLDHMLA